MPIPLYIYCIGFSLLMALINYRWLKPSQLKAFVPFLFITLAVELAGAYTNHARIQNGLLYNAYVTLQVIFCSWFFRSFKMPQVYQRIISFALILYILAIAIVYAFVTSPAKFNIPLFLTGGFLIVLFAIFFLFNYFSLDDQLEEVVLSPVIWISIGLIAYFTVLSITVSLISYILFYDLKIGGVKLHNIVPRIMSIIMYLCFAYSFYKCRKLNQK